MYNGSMPCGQGNYPPFRRPQQLDIRPLTEVATSGRTLVVSNSPETIVGASMMSAEGVPTQTLYKCEVPVAGTRLFRVWGWHHRDGTEPTTVHVITSVVGGTAVTLDDYVAESNVGANQTSIGICIAKIQLYQTFPAERQPIGLSGSEVSVFSIDIPPGQTAGFILQFKVTSSAPTTLHLRTAFGSGQAIPGNWADDPAAPDSHVRGWWPYSSAILPTGICQVVPQQAPEILHEYSPCEASGAEHGPSAFAKQAADLWGTANGDRGCYGANLFYDTTLRNDTGQALPVYASLFCRNVPSYYGAVRIEQPSAYTPRGVPLLKYCEPSGTTCAHDNFVELTTGPQGQPAPVMVAAGTAPNLRTAVANGGACSTPFNILLTGLPSP